MLGPKGIDPWVRLVAMEEEVGGTEICCSTDEGIAGRNWEFAGIDSLGESTDAVGEGVESTVVASEVSGHDCKGRSQDFSDVCATIGRG